MSPAYVLAIFIPSLLLITTILISFHSMKDREKVSPYECGFDPSSSARLPFSSRFFLLAVIFLVFDIEIVLLMPLPMMSLSSVSNLTPIVFLIILILGLLHEWNEGSLDWSW